MRILFVDDEPFILEGLQNNLRRNRRRWDMHFALGAEAALEAFRAAPFDVIVTDMRMPKMDGAALLAVIHDEYPQTIRIILSGYTEQEAVLRAIPVAHQFLSKPCDVTTLEAAIERATALRERITDPRLLSLIGSIGSLPSHPRVHARIEELLRSPDCTTDQIAALVEEDAAVCAKMLQIVNSAFFGLARRITSVQETVTLLGTNVLSHLVLSAAIFEDVDARSAGRFDGMKRHSMRTAGIARAIALHRGDVSPDDAFVTGLLHDVGHLIILSRAEHVWKRIQEEHTAHAERVQDTERRLLGITHGQIGGYLLGLWGLPQKVVEAVVFHHAPAEVPQTRMELVTVVHVADALAHEVDDEGDLPEHGESAVLDRDHLQRLGVLEELDTWRTLDRDPSGDRREAA